MARVTYTVEITLRVEVQADPTFDHESATEMGYRMFESAQAAGVLEDPDGVISKIIRVDSDFLNTELQP